MGAWIPGGWRAGLVSCHDHKAPLEQGRRTSTAELTEHLKVGRADTQSTGVPGLWNCPASPFVLSLPPAPGIQLGALSETSQTSRGTGLKWISPSTRENCFTVLQGSEMGPRGRRALGRRGSRSLACGPPLPSCSISMQFRPSNLGAPAVSFLLKCLKM